MNQCIKNMNPINKTRLLIQDRIYKENYFCITEATEINKSQLPMLNEVVKIPFSSTINGFIFNKEQSYKVTEINNDFIEGALLIFLARI